MFHLLTSVNQLCKNYGCIYFCRMNSNKEKTDIKLRYTRNNKTKHPCISGIPDEIVIVSQLKHILEMDKKIS